MFARDTRVRYSQLAPGGALSLPALLDLFQDIATEHAQSAGAGPDELYAQQRAWILSRWRVRLGALPRCGAAIRVETRAYSCRKALSRRDFTLLDSEGAVLARADSLWTLVDTATGGITDASQVVAPYLVPEEGPDLGDLPRKVRLPEAMETGEPFSVTRDLLDTNLHVNNVRSVALAMGQLPADQTFTALAADYHHPLLPGDRVTPMRAATPTGYTVALTAGGQCCILAEFIR